MLGEAPFIGQMLEDLEGPIRPEYAVIVQTPEWGEVCLLLHSGGQRLKPGRLETEVDEQFRRMVGAEPPEKPENLEADYSCAKIVQADPNMQIYLHGNWTTLSEVAAGLYSRAQSDTHELQELRAQTSKQSFLFKYRWHIIGVTAAAMIAPLAFSPVIIDTLGLPETQYYIGAGALTVVSYGLAMWAVVKKMVPERRKRNEAEAKLELKVNALLGEYDAARASLLRAGALSGMFPQGYGLT